MLLSNYPLSAHGRECSYTPMLVLACVGFYLGLVAINRAVHF